MVSDIDYLAGTRGFSSSNQGRTMVTRPELFIGVREPRSARGHALSQLFAPVQHDSDLETAIRRLAIVRRIEKHGEQLVAIRHEIEISDGGQTSQRATHPGDLHRLAR